MFSEAICKYFPQIVIYSNFCLTFRKFDQEIGYVANKK